MSSFERKMISLLLSLTLVFSCFNLGTINSRAMETEEEMVVNDINPSEEIETDEQQPDEELSDVTEDVLNDDTLDEESAIEGEVQDSDDAETTDEPSEIDDSYKGLLGDKELAVGDSVYMEAGWLHDNYDDEVSWSCDNTDVVRIEPGKKIITIHALAPGKATIVARCAHGYEEKCCVVVIEKKVNKIFGDFSYIELEDGTIEITGYDGEDKNIIIPSVIEGKNVSTIGKKTFFDNKSIEKVTIPKSVTSIQYEAFRGSSLCSIEFENSSELKTIEDAAFFDTSLSTITIPAKVENIGGYAFYCSAIKEIIIPDSVKTIDVCAFERCRSLETVRLNNTITEISDGLFYECESLKIVNIPSSVKKIGESAFEYCKSLDNIVLPNELTQIGDFAFCCCNLKEIIIPDSVIAIGESAFANNEQLAKAILSNNLTYISKECFCGCPISELSIGGKTKKIGIFAFAGNRAITSVTIPNSVTDLQYKSFASCSKLKNIQFSEELTNVNGYALEETAWYNNQPNGMVYAGPVVYQYKGKAADNTQIVIKNNTKGIASFAFYEQSGLTSVKLNDDLQVINFGAFLGCSLNSIIIPASVTEIGDYALGYDLSGDKKYIYDAKENVAYYCNAKKRDNFEIFGSAGSVAESYAKNNGFKFIEVPTTAGIYIHEMSKDKIIAGLVTDVKDKSNLEYSWYATSDEGSTWETISDWRIGYEWLDWEPDKYGDYVIVGKVRVKGEDEILLQDATNVSFHPQIMGICQMPYSDENGAGYLIGIQSYDNPDQKYRYEMLILDCTLLLQGLPAWTYTTGQFTVPEGNAGWCIWRPQYGYYWTLFRVYDENGVLLDEKCYGFANIC